LATTFDFQIISNTAVPGLSLVCPLNESALDYLTDEACMTTLRDGSAPLAIDNVGDFISNAGHAHFACDYQ
jgi:hypothetical protein